MMGFWDTVASAGPYANNLHLTPHQHLITQFLQARWSSRQPINSVKALKARLINRVIVKKCSINFFD